MSDQFSVSRSHDLPTPPNLEKKQKVGEENPQLWAVSSVNNGQIRRATLFSNKDDAIQYLYDMKWTTILVQCSNVDASTKNDRESVDALWAEFLESEEGEDTDVILFPASFWTNQ